ncbi:MAG: hypothetical protein U0103_12325 [Candidatus Obscuribacterales bacterium]
MTLDRLQKATGHIAGNNRKKFAVKYFGIIGGVSKHQSSSLCKQIICRFANTMLRTLRSTTRSSLGIACGAWKFGKKRLATSFMY